MTADGKVVFEFRAENAFFLNIIRNSNVIKLLFLQKLKNDIEKELQIVNHFVFEN